MSIDFIFSLAIQYVTEYPSPILFGILLLGPISFFAFRKRMNIATASLCAAGLSSLLIVGGEMLMRGLSALFPIALILTFILIFPFCIVIIFMFRIFVRRLTST
jgi:hypothetical protein